LTDSNLLLIADIESSSIGADNAIEPMCRVEKRSKTGNCCAIGSSKVVSIPSIILIDATIQSRCQSGNYSKLSPIRNVSTTTVLWSFYPVSRCSIAHQDRSQDDAAVSDHTWGSVSTFNAKDMKMSNEAYTILFWRRWPRWIPPAATENPSPMS
jgi:hypothetical protein